MFVLCTLALSAQGQEVVNDTIDKYVIDKEIVEQFDGTQLEGKTISKYMIAYKNAGNVVEKNHIIITEKQDVALNGKPASIVKFDGLIIVDGKEVDFSDINSLKTDDIASMVVLKPNSEAAESYGEKGRNGVLIITTKSKNVYFVDGKKADKDEVDKLSPERIASMNVIKKEGYSVIDIVTKK